MPRSLMIKSIGKVLLTTLFILCISSLSPAQEFAGVGLGFGYGHAFPLGGTKNGNLRDTEFTRFDIWGRFYLVEFLDGVLSEDLGFEVLTFDQPDGNAFFAVENTRWEYLGWELIRPFISARLGVGGSDVHGGWNKQHDGLLFALEPSIGVYLYGIEVSYVFHHMSNANLYQPNSGINSNCVLVSVTVPL